MTIGTEIQEHLRDKGLYTGPIDDDFGDGTKLAVAKALGLHSAAGAKHISKAGLDLIKVSEGLVLKAYRDAVDVLTIGYGHTGPDVHEGMIVTEAQAEALLLGDIERFERAVEKLCPNTTQGQFDALVSFTFNLGEKSLKESTLRRLHNEAAYEAAAGQFSRWVNAGGRQLPGLVKRRAAEAKMYRGGS